MDLLGWMTTHHLPLSLSPEADEECRAIGWVVVDLSTNAVLASGETAEIALIEAYTKERK